MLTARVYHFLWSFLKDPERTYTVISPCNYVSHLLIGIFFPKSRLQIFRYRHAICMANYVRRKHA